MFKSDRNGSKITLVKEDNGEIHQYAEVIEPIDPTKGVERDRVIVGGDVFSGITYESTQDISVIDIADYINDPSFAKSIHFGGNNSGADDVDFDPGGLIIRWSGDNEPGTVESVFISIFNRRADLNVTFENMIVSSELSFRQQNALTFQIIKHSSDLCIVAAIKKT